MWKINLGIEGEKSAAYTLFPAKFYTKMEACYTAFKMAECNRLEALNNALIYDDYTSSCDDLVKIIFHDSESKEDSSFIKVKTKSKEFTYWIIETE